MFGTKGKYDDLLKESLEKVNALRGMIIILDGNKGSGFSSVLCDESLEKIPNILRNVANQIENDNKQLKKRH